MRIVPTGGTAVVIDLDEWRWRRQGNAASACDPLNGHSPDDCEWCDWPLPPLPPGPERCPDGCDWCDPS